MTDVTYETELKLRIEASAARQVAQHPLVAALKEGRARTTMLHSVYFDTSDLRLANAGVAVRLRRAGRDWLQTVKGATTSQSGGGLAQRIEIESRLPRSRDRPALDQAKLADTPFGSIIAKTTRHSPLVPAFVTRFERTAVPLRLDDRTTATLCVDVGSIHAGERATLEGAKAPIAEVEIELGDGDPVQLFDLALALAEDVSFTVETRSKASRGFDLVAPRLRHPVPSEAIAFPREATAAQAMAAVLRTCVRQIEANADGVCSSDDPEWIHQMRVGVRRTRCALGLLRGVLPADELEPTGHSLRWLAERLGAIRDLDVFESQTLAALGSATTHEHDGDAALATSIRELRERTRHEAQEARLAARDAVASPRFVKLLLELGRLAASLHLRTTEGSPQGAVLAQPASTFAVERLARRYRKTRRAARRFDESAASRHALRVQAKKLRYAAEFFAPLFEDKPVRKFVKALAGLQRALGAANDASVAAQLAARLSPDGKSAALVAGWTTAQREGDPKQRTRAWRDVADAKRFWNDAHGA